MIEVSASMQGYGTDTCDAETPEAALVAATTLADDIRRATGSAALVECRFVVDGATIRTVWL